MDLVITKKRKVNDITRDVTTGAEYNTGTINWRKTTRVRGLISDPTKNYYLWGESTPTSRLSSLGDAKSYTANKVEPGMLEEVVKKRDQYSEVLEVCSIVY